MVKTVKGVLQLPLTVLTLLFVCAQQLCAQQASVDSARIEAARAALLAIPLGSRIRIETVGNSVIEGRLAARSDTGIVIGQKNDSSRASLVRVAGIFRPARNLKRGAVAGGLTGGLVGGLLLGAFAASFCESTSCNTAFTDGATLGALFGAATGAIVGVGVGALSHHWQRVWP
ncbi:MAG TPA: hypothetical protein VJ865_01445 [Gemmatimonadaceae bacterium]|nr:hypothetical protein [Gemmatimonadaceae bacterium]